MSVQSRLISRVSRLNRSFAMVEPGDRVMVACSGGKDSWAMLLLLREWVARLPFEVSLVAMNLDQGHPGFPAATIEAHFRREGFAYRMVTEDTYSVVLAETPEGKTYCSRCSRMRRGVLHRVAAEIGANKIALGHHRDDVIETLLLNMMFAGRLRTMPPKLEARGDGAAVIRPLLTCAEADLAQYAAASGVPIVPCNLCGSQPDTQRKRVRALLASLEVDNPRLRSNLLAAAANVEPEHLLDRRLSAALGLTSAVGDREDDLAVGGVHEVHVPAHAITERVV